MLDNVNMQSRPIFAYFAMLCSAYFGKNCRIFLTCSRWYCSLW